MCTCNDPSVEDWCRVCMDVTQKERWCRSCTTLHAMFGQH